jgi:hypothetical protein
MLDQTLQLTIWVLTVAVCLGIPVLIVLSSRRTEQPTKPEEQTDPRWWLGEGEPPAYAQQEDIYE